MSNYKEDIKNMINEIKDFYKKTCVGVVITGIYNKFNILKGKSKLYRNNGFDKSGSIVILESPEIFLRNYDADAVNIKNSRVREEIEKFVNIIKDNVPEKDLVAMYNNLSNLRIKSADVLLVYATFINRVLLFNRKVKVGEMYKFSSNSILMYSDLANKIGLGFKDSNIRKLLFYHELLHMASTKRKQNKYCSGFYHRYAILPTPTAFDFSIGKSINEGYTELLNERFFGHKNNGGAYEFYKEVARILEEVVGQEEMTSLYFNADLNGLINSLNTYISEKETKNFLVSFDKLFKQQKNISLVIQYIVNLYTNKIDKDLTDKKIDKETAIKQFSDLTIRISKLNDLFSNVSKKSKGDYIKDTDVYFKNIPSDKKTFR